MRGAGCRPQRGLWSPAFKHISPGALDIGHPMSCVDRQSRGAGSPSPVFPSLRPPSASHPWSLPSEGEGKQHPARSSVSGSRTMERTERSRGMGWEHPPRAARTLCKRLHLMIKISSQSLVFSSLPVLPPVPPLPSTLSSLLSAKKEKKKKNHKALLHILGPSC